MVEVTKTIETKVTKYRPSVTSIEDMFKDEVLFDTREECSTYEEKAETDNNILGKAYFDTGLREGRIKNLVDVLCNSEYVGAVHLRDEHDLAYLCAYLESEKGCDISDLMYCTDTYPYDVVIDYSTCGWVHSMDITNWMKDNRDLIADAEDFLSKNNPTSPHSCRSKDVYFFRDDESLEYATFARWEDAINHMADWLSGTLEDWEVLRIRSCKSYTEYEADTHVHPRGESFFERIGDTESCYITKITYLG